MCREDRRSQAAPCYVCSSVIWGQFLHLFVSVDSSHVRTSNFCSEGAFQQLCLLVRNGRGSTFGVKPKWVGSLSSRPPGPSPHPWNSCSVLVLPCLSRLPDPLCEGRRERWGDQIGLDVAEELSLGLVLILVPWWLVLFGNRSIHSLVMLRIEISDW